MRVVAVLLAAIAVSGSTAAPDAQPTSILASGLAKLIGPDHATDKRLLRTGRDADGDNFDDKDNDEENGIDDEEERFKQWKINDLINGKTSTLFSKWKGRLLG
ncbi:secreted RxLR effector peptide protein, putative [Phytophthora infestans T30-4]|uniref:RxLR effector protein n=2 Tax=Phytophthora infestans TaxID=4787 RepID=D0N6C8_PHYIT|nr:secreted RxLR effector peptide protein, putative [Phytophthora infestans T30-4]EEY70619.1 secreted RxLR effector peptide protein, putative [Phytophthora infestans T30-4]KAF4045390.1 hypothetical protein GN244_ATG02131 [Phytophthora infestans]KAF4129730.1 hypothetical protein GN958_ATG21225 [Phytophthora infestans]|eukprot:XP_002998273.1 secreted RxLR effector peptide protein, putative [Phytophthora infestans T30-4]